MKNLKRATLLIVMTVFLTGFYSCGEHQSNDTALQEQDHTEKNQQHLNAVQPPPDVEWSLERDNLIKRFQLMNDRTVVMYMYLFIEGVGSPIGYYQINKVSSVNSQLTNPNQIIQNSTYEHGNYSVLASPAEDGSYGTNGNGVFGFTPDGLYIEHNMKYIVSTAPLLFKDVPMIGEISIETSKSLKEQLKNYD